MRQRDGSRGSRRIKPLQELPSGARRIWREIVGALAADHFGPQDRVALAAYCHAADRLCMEFERDHQDPGSARVSDVRELVAIVARLGPQLRIAPSSRIDAERAGSSRRRQRTEYEPAAAPDWRAAMREAGTLN